MMIDVEPLMVKNDISILGVKEEILRLSLLSNQHNLSTSTAGLSRSSNQNRA